jgi:hypothetical protein
MHVSSVSSVITEDRTEITETELVGLHFLNWLIGLCFWMTKF